jgi:ubiquitin-activating enzyme E1
MEQQIDEGLYSRQLYAVGFDAMKRMANSSILISGMTGLGVEIAKNVILQGFKRVTLHDNKHLTNSDLSTNYYVTRDDVGKNRAECSFKKLSELNNYVKVDVVVTELNNYILKNHNVVVLVDYDVKEQLLVNNFTHQNKIHFISTCTKGLVGQIFCDFGDNFVVTDPDGEQPPTSIVENIRQDGENLLVTCIESKPHGLMNGDYVKFNNVKENHALEITYVDKFNFKIKNNILIPCEIGVEISGVKMPMIINFKPLNESIEAPEFNITDFTDFEKPNKLHAMFRSLTHADTFGNFTKKVKEYREVDDILMSKFYHTYKGNLVPMNSVIGGIVGQEVAKACSGKFTPINQWMYFDAFDCLPDNYKELDKTIRNSRYCEQIKVFGDRLQIKFFNMKYFIVGSGAIGCELLKNFAMMGLGNIIITDMDTIEKSNLNRQFLFRNKDIGKSKSSTAAAAIKEMNPEIKIEAHFNKVGPETENVYNMQFFTNLDGVANALDNIDARRYVDGRCVLFKKSLLESGTLGTKGNVQVVVPRLTESYNSSSDPPEASIPICTIKTFPNDISHCIAWTREVFEDLFVAKPKNVIEYINNPEKVKTIPASDLISYSQNIKFVTENNPQTFNDCVRVAYQMWHEYYVVQIEQLLYKFPPNTVTSTGSPFWVGAKKCPHSFKFDVNNELHMNYIVSFANIWANIFNIQYNNDMNHIIQILSKLEPPKIIINKGAHISVNDEEEKKRQQEELEKPVDIGDLIKALPDSNRFKGLKLTPQEFEKDDDRNYHIDFMSAASNMRAINYDIKDATRHAIKGIAGKIIPALATTTSVVAGLVALELYKLAQNFTKLESYRNSFLNLALPYVGYSEPIKTKINKVSDKEYTIWDTFIIQGGMTLEQLLKYFKEEHKIDIDTIIYGNFMLYGSIMNKKKMNTRMVMNIRDIIETELNTKLTTSSIALQICTDIEKEENVELPEIIYLL